jgi:hypothetical protein
MVSLLRALVVFALLCGSTTVGLLLRCQLLKGSGQTSTLDSTNLVISFLVTITAIVIGLLINSTKSFIDATEDRWAMFAGQLIQLDQSLRNYGTETEPTRRKLQSFTAGGIANFWRTATLPIGVAYPDVRRLSRDDAKQVLTELLARVELEIIRLMPSDPLHERLAADCFDQFKELARARWALLLAPQNSLPAPFLRTLITWLMMVFVCFGMRVPADPLVIIMVALSAITLSSMMFAIIDIVDPYKGLYNISSKNMHQALGTMLEHDATKGPLAHPGSTGIAPGTISGRTSDQPGLSLLADAESCSTPS